jgi:hypothetical protein
MSWDLFGRRQMMDGWMYGYGSFHWFWFIVMVVLVVYPVGRILNRIGFSPLWAIAMFIPLLNLIVLWILAFTEWPGGRGGGARNPSPPI